MQSHFLFLVLLFFRIVQCSNSPRIINGEPVSLGKLPFMAALFKNISGVVKYFCGGSVVNQDTILTAAHCLKRKQPDQVFVYLGKTDIINLDKEYMFRTKKFIRNPRYWPLTLRNDLAIVKLTVELDFHELLNVKPVCFASSDVEVNKQNCFVLGWGYVNQEYKEVSTSLLQVRVPILDDQTCRKIDKSYSSRSMFCAGNLEGGGDTCKGDSGSPLVCGFNDELETFAQYGLVSYGDGCGKPNSPTFYTKLTSYLDWIRNEAIN